MQPQTKNAAWRDKQRAAGLQQKLIWVSEVEWPIVKALIDKLRKLRGVKT